MVRGCDYCAIDGNFRKWEWRWAVIYGTWRRALTAVYYGMEIYYVWVSDMGLSITDRNR